MHHPTLDFIIIGAPKSATTWLQRSLQLDPAVFMPDSELHFFSREWERGPDWYARNFPDTGMASLLGEKSASYLEAPEASGRMASLQPGARLIAQLRNPIDRAYSDFCMLLRRGSIGRSVEDYLDPRRCADGRFLRGGRYGEQLRRYLDHFPAEQIRIVLYEDIKADPAGEVARVREFIGCPARDPVPVATERVKDRTTPIVPPRVKKALRPADPVLRLLRGTPAWRVARSAVAREMTYPPLPETVARRLHDYYRDDAEEVARLVRRDLSGWLVAGSRAAEG